MTGGTNAAEAALLAEIRRAVPLWYGPGAVASEASVHRRPWSVHAEAVVVAGDRTVRLIAKVPLWEEAPDLESALAAGPQASTRAEHRALQEIEAMVAVAGDEGLEAVRPVAYLEEVNAVVTEHLDARPLRAVRGRARVEAARRTGRWLRLFHEGIGGSAPGGFEASSTDPLLVAAERTGNRHLAAAAAALRERAAALEGSPVRVGTTHGDLGPSNVLVTGAGRVAVIDPNLEPGRVTEDLAKLAVAMRTGRSRLVTGIPAGASHPAEEALLEGYGAVPPDVYLMDACLAALRRWTEIEAGAGAGRRPALAAARRVMAMEAGRAG